MADRNTGRSTQSGDDAMDAYAVSAARRPECTRAPAIATTTTPTAIAAARVVAAADRRTTRASDERIKEDLSERLADDPTIDASDIDIEVKDRVVTLTGTVEARHLKHRVEDMADRCGGVQDVQNRLTVKARNVPGSESLLGQGAASGAKNATTGSRDDDTTRKRQCGDS